MARSLRKEKNMARVRQDILTASAKAFVKGGYKGTTIEDIAKEAAYAPSSLYNYFSGKQEIYAMLLTEITEQFLKIFQEPMLPSMGFRQRFEMVLSRIFTIIEQNKEFYLVFIANRPNEGFAYATGEVQVCTSNYEKWIEQMEALISEGISQQAISFLDKRSAAYYITGMIKSTIFRWVNKDLRARPKITSHYFREIHLNKY